MIEWFFDSLRRETGGDFSDIKIVVVDFWNQVGAEKGWTQEHVDERRVEIRGALYSFMPADQFEEYHGSLRHVAPKSCVWQGKDRLTKENWFAASNARNTAVCLAPDGWLAFVDDLSVLMPGWLTRVRAAMAGDQKTVTCGAYRKVKELVVENGNVVSFVDHPGGHDNRYGYGNDSGPVACHGNWMYGCSLVAPVQAFLDINGWPEALCDGLSFEDCICGLFLEKKGYRFLYDRTMMTYESEELHAQLPIMKRSDYGVSPNDKSHAVLKMAREGNGWHPNYFGEEGIAGLRQRALAGESFPVVQIPEHEWWTGTRLAEL